MKKQTNPFWRLIKGLDQAGNGLCGGSEDETISGRVGYFGGRKGHSKWWSVLEQVIDLTFIPVDGVGHCKQSIEWAEHKPKVTTYNLVTTTILVFLFCPVLAVITWGLVAPAKLIKAIL